MLRGFFERARKIAEQFIPGLLREGASTNEIVGQLQKAGVDYGAAAMRSDVEGMQAEATRAEISAPFDPTKPVPEMFFKDRRWRSVWDYHYEFRYSWYDEQTKMTQESYFTIVKKERVSTNELQLEVDQMVSRIGISLEAQVLVVELVSGVHVVSGRK